MHHIGTPMTLYCTAELCLCLCRRCGSRPDSRCNACTMPRFAADGARLVLDAVRPTGQKREHSNTCTRKSRSQTKHFECCLRRAAKNVLRKFELRCGRTNAVDVSRAWTSLPPYRPLTAARAVHMLAENPCKPSMTTDLSFLEGQNTNDTNAALQSPRGDCLE